MYAVYGLDEDCVDVEEFMGYIPRDFVKDYICPARWRVRTMYFPNGSVQVGRQYGRAFFVGVPGLKADDDKIRRYMGVDSPPPDDVE